MRALVLAALLLAGCATPAAVVAPPPAPSEGDALVFALTGCTQTHTFAPYPVEAFAGMLPEGWALQPADPLGRTTQFFLAASLCEGASEAWGHLFVVPPGGNDPNASGDLWPLGGAADAALAARYHAWGLEGIIVEGDVAVAFSSPAPGALASSTVVVARDETFRVDASAQATQGAFHEGAFRVWIPSSEAGAQPTGSFLYAWGEGGIDLGLGGGTLRYEGELLNAPPAGPAAVHHVRDVAVNVTRLA